MAGIVAGIGFDELGTLYRPRPISATPAIILRHAI